MKKCTACKSLGLSREAYYEDYIYRNGSQSSLINLCYAHSVELFKMGQSSFVLKYKDSVDIEPSPKAPENKLANYFVFNSFR